MKSHSDTATQSGMYYAGFAGEENGDFSTPQKLPNMVFFLLQKRGGEQGGQGEVVFIHSPPKCFFFLFVSVSYLSILFLFSVFFFFLVA